MVLASTGRWAVPPVFRARVPSILEPDVCADVETEAARFEAPPPEFDTSFHSGLYVAIKCPAPGSATSCLREAIGPVPAALERLEEFPAVETDPRRG